MKKRKISPLILYILILGVVFYLVAGAFSGLIRGPAYSEVVRRFEE